MATATMPPAHPSFNIIEQYRNLAKHVLKKTEDEEESTCHQMVSLDQEVPQSWSSVEAAGDSYSPDHIKMEVPESTQPDLFTLMESMLESRHENMTNTNSIPTSASQSEFQQFFLSSRDSHSTQLVAPSSSLHQSSVSSTSLMLSSSSPPLSSSKSPLLSSAAYSSSARSPTAVSTHQSGSPRTTSSSLLNVKTSSYVTELGGSGCIVMAPAQSTTDYLPCEVFSLPADQPNFLVSETPSSVCVPEENLNYLDLDKQPVSLYDDLKMPMADDEPVKSEPSAGSLDSFHLEEAALMMRDVIHHDCDTLKVPYDPILWTTEHVQTWVAWVCQKNGLRDISSYVFPLDGKNLCSLSALEISSHYGEAGDSIRTELELWKAANSCFPDSSDVSLSYGLQGVPLLQNEASFVNTQQRPSATCVTKVIQHGAVSNSSGTPCVSPAPSNDSLGYGVMEASDNSDSECSSSDDPSPFRHQAPKVGRGHKQTIHLWQFLRELLLSKENRDDCIRWLDRRAGIFKIEDSKKVAFLWGQRKNRPAMNYDKLSRSVRQYYKKKIIKKTAQSKRLVYQFCPGYL